MATPASAIAGAVGEALAPLVIEFGADGLKLWGRKRGKKGADNRATIKRLEIPSPVYLPLVALLIGAIGDIRSPSEAAKESLELAKGGDVLGALQKLLIPVG